MMNKKRKRKKIGELAAMLKLDEVELKECKQSDITRTCRKVVKVLYPDNKIRAQQFVSKMPRKALEAIHGKCRIRGYTFITNFKCFQ
jgi:hypothetical protein